MQTLRKEKEEEEITKAVVLLIAKLKEQVPTEKVCIECPLIDLCGNTYEDCTAFKLLEEVLETLEGEGKGS